MRAYNPLDGILDMRVRLAWSLVFFFCKLSGKPWDSLPFTERVDARAIADSIR